MPNANAFDEKTLIAYLTTSVEGFKGPATVTKFAGGQSNPTFKI